MKKFFKFSMLILVVFVSITAVRAQSNTSIEGYWFNDIKEAKVQIFKHSDGKYYGQIVWLKEPNRNGHPKLDEKNKDEKLRSRPIMGLHVLKGFSKDEDIYTGGTIYDPKNGKTYDCKITPKDANTLAIRGYIGVSLLGRTTVWTRTSK